MGAYMILQRASALQWRRQSFFGAYQRIQWCRGGGLKPRRLEMIRESQGLTGASNNTKIQFMSGPACDVLERHESYAMELPRFRGHIESDAEGGGNDADDTSTVRA